MPVALGRKRAATTGVRQNPIVGESSASRRVLARADDEGRRHGWLGTEHLLLALLEHRESRASGLLAEYRVVADDLRSEVDAVNATNATGLAPGKATPTPHAKHALAIAGERAGVDDTTPEHVLLGILEVGSLAFSLLDRRGVDIAGLRERL